jgi:hypothetical protein
VRVTAEVHPLFGRLLWASGFKRLGGVLHLVVTLPDGSPGTIRADATGVFGDGLEVQGMPTTCRQTLRRFSVATSLVAVVSSKTRLVRTVAWLLCVIVAPCRFASA